MTVKVIAWEEINKKRGNCLDCFQLRTKKAKGILMAQCQHRLLPKKLYPLESKELTKAGMQGHNCLLFKR